MYRTVALILALTVVFFVVRSGEEPVQVLRAPEVGPAPEAFETAAGPSARGRIAVERAPDEGNLKIGGFEKPARDPDYEVLEKIDERDGARGATPHRHPLARGGRFCSHRPQLESPLLRLRSDFDAVSVEFTDTEDVLFYNGDALTRHMLAYYGGALIFNTYEGSDYLGYIYGPPNMEGYYVQAAD